MSEPQEILKESSSVIQEIEIQLERMLAGKKDGIERDLAGKIQMEKDTARRKMDDVLKEFDHEKEALDEFRVMVTEGESERDGILDEMREHLKRALHLQAEIETMARQTIGEIKRVNELQQKLEAMRRRTSERAAFLRNDLREKYGIVAEVPEHIEIKPAAVDLDEELVKLKKIKELLSDESLRREEGADQDRLAPGSEQPLYWDIKVPEIQDLIQAAPSPENPGRDSLPAEASGGSPAPVEQPRAKSVALLEKLRKKETADGVGEIRYFQKDQRFILDPEHLLQAVDNALEEARKLSVRLDEIESPRDRFLIKHELINGQEGLRRLILRAVKLSDKRFPVFPGRIQDVWNIQGLKELLERLSLENWANPKEFASFEKDMKALQAAVLDKMVPADSYYDSVLADLEGE
jgi:hypothetical protein